MARTYGYDWDGHRHAVPVRDLQRQRVYDAEHACFREHRASQQLRNLTEEQLQELVDGIVCSDFWRRLLARSDMKPVHVTVKIRGARHHLARGGRHCIKLPGSWALNLHTFLHELAHSATDWPARHNWPFAAVMLELVGAYMGAEWQERLWSEYCEKKVKFLAPKVYE